MVDLMTSVDPSQRPSMKTVETFVVRIHQCLLEDRTLSAASPSAAVAAEEGGADPEQPKPPARSNLRGSFAVSTDIPSVEVLPAKEMGGASDGGGGSTGGPSVPVVAPANRGRNRSLARSDHRRRCCLRSCCWCCRRCCCCSPCCCYRYCCSYCCCSHCC